MNYHYPFITPSRYIRLLRVLLLSAVLFASCKQLEPLSPYPNYPDQPPLGKDTVRGMAIDVSFPPYLSSNVVHVTVKDDQDGALYDLQLWWHVLPETGICRIDTADIIGPASQFLLPPLNKDYDSVYILVKQPKPVNLDITMYDGRIKSTLGVKKVYVRITAETEIAYGADNKALKSLYLRPDSLGRARAEYDIELSLRNRLGNDKGHFINDFSPISLIFQRR